MNLRKIAVFGGFAVGAALTLAPLASADTIGDAVSSEEALLNSIFESETTLAGDSGDVTLASAANPFDIITPADIALVQGTGDTLGTTPFDYLVYGLDPTAAGLASDPGSYNVFNGALTEFADAYNVELYSLANPDALVSSVPLDDLFGSSTTIATALGESTFSGAIGEFLTVGLADLSAYL
jgi:hypothetical protein